MVIFLTQHLLGLHSCTCRKPLSLQAYDISGSFKLFHFNSVILNCQDMFLKFHIHDNSSIYKVSLSANMTCNLFFFLFLLIILVVLLLRLPNTLTLESAWYILLDAHQSPGRCCPYILTLSHAQRFLHKLLGT